MKLKSVSGVTCYVTNLERSTAFYETVGFEIRRREHSRSTAYLNWFWIDLIVLKEEPRAAYRKEVEAGLKGSGPLVYISVDDVEGAYQELLSKGLKPSGKPQDSPWGTREFFLKDPDKNKLVFFQKK